MDAVNAVRKKGCAVIVITAYLIATAALGLLTLMSWA